MFLVCSLCLSTVKFPNNIAIITENKSECALCFGILQNYDLHAKIIEKIKFELKKNNYDGKTFLLALNTPITMHFREILMEKLLGDAWVPMLMSPKCQLSVLLMSKISEATELKPTLNSNLVLNITLIHDEFLKKDVEYLVVNFSKQLFNCGRKRKRPLFDDVAFFYTKVRLNQIENSMTKDLANKYNMSSPTQPFNFTVRFERNSVYIGGRYLKFSRNLPQSPWTSEPYATKVSGNSVSEKISEILKTHFGADNYKFIACGREDIDVRMLGNGRPFAVELLNARQTNSLNSFLAVETFKLLEKKINAENLDIKVVFLFQPSSKQVLSLNVGIDEKRKIYSALCYSKIPVTDEMIYKLKSSIPVEILQKTVIRVLKRRPLIDRKRTIFALSALKLDDYHFVIKLETQAGTYVKEFVHSDFGRTRPSIGNLMGINIDSVDILRLDVEGVNFNWPPLIIQTR